MCLKHIKRKEMDPVSISIIVAVGILLIDRIYNWSATIVKSHCCCIDITRTQTEQVNTNNDIKSIGNLENVKK